MRIKTPNGAGVAKGTGPDPGDGSRGRSEEDGEGGPDSASTTPASQTPRDQSGCPGCVHYLACDVYNVSLDRLAALVVLRSIVNAEEGTFGSFERTAGSGSDPTAAGDGCGCCANGRHGKRGGA